MEAHPPIFDGEAERVAVRLDPPVGMRLRAQLEHAVHRLLQIDPVRRA